MGTELIQFPFETLFIFLITAKSRLFNGLGILFIVLFVGVKITKKEVYEFRIMK